VCKLHLLEQDIIDYYDFFVLAFFY